MKFKSFMALSCLAVLLFSSCNNDEPTPKPKPDEPKDVPTKTLSFITQEKALQDYDKWVYVNLETGETVMKEDVSEQEWRTYSDAGKKKDRFGKYDVTKTVEARPSNAREVALGFPHFRRDDQRCRSLHDRYDRYRNHQDIADKRKMGERHKSLSYL
ncbi:hypothetical protein [Prevotella falsenii]|uniref:hypothetical protein n=1 Tax=Prevotella falsenii TaxID=515414 RepID=UPI000B05B26A|nr:hypothetical protein [Prevotella falsenii]